MLADEIQVQRRPERGQALCIEVDAAIEEGVFRALQDDARVDELLALHGWNHA
jgi:hypothetical protein